MFDKFVNDNNIFKDKMVNSTIHTAKQIINRNKKYRVGQRSIITSAFTIVKLIKDKIYDENKNADSCFFVTNINVVQNND